MSVSWQDGLCKELQGLMAEGRVVPIVGSGVSTATAAIPGWRGVLEDGLRHLAEIGTCSEAELSEARSLLSANDLIAAAQRMCALMGCPGGEYPFWLKKEFEVGREQIHNRRLIDRIVDLPVPLIATTNYDRLISTLHPEAHAPVTWLHPAAMQVALREGDRVLHLHGVYEEPASVVFGIESYSRIVSDPAYRAVLQSLWLERTLLFIGCSFDGLQDPDFRALLDWASETFADSFYKHYALFRAGTFTTEEARRFNQQWRIQIVDYGPSFDDLPAWLESVNPYRERASARRSAKIKELYETQDPAYLDAAISLLQSLRRPDAPEEIDIALEAQRLFQKHQSRAAELHGNFCALQRLTRTMVDPEAVRRSMLGWRVGYKADPQGYSAQVFAAAEALFLFPDSMLHALKARGVDIHANILSGYCLNLMDDLRTLPLEDRVMTGDYAAENMMRIMRALHSIFEADADMVFPLPQEGQKLSAQESAALVVVRGDAIELRELESPHRQLALLPTNTLETSGAEVVRLRGEPAIVAYNRESLLAWEPRRAATPLAEFFPGGVGPHLHSVSHLETEDGLETVALNWGGLIYRLRDLRLTGEVQTPGESSDYLRQIVLMPGNRLFGITREDNLVRVKDDGSYLQLIASSELPRLLALQPVINLTADMRLGHFDLYRREFNGQTLLALVFTARNETRSDTLVVFFDTQGERIFLHACLRMEGKELIRFTVVNGEDGAPRLVGTLLTGLSFTSEAKEDLIVWMRGVPTRKGWLFLPEGSTLRNADDMIHIVMADQAHGFASDDSRALFSFSIADGSFALIDRAESRIKGLHVARWP
jgi:hypothetical protein